MTHHFWFFRCFSNSIANITFLSKRFKLLMFLLYVLRLSKAHLLPINYLAVWERGSGQKVAEMENKNFSNNRTGYRACYGKILAGNISCVGWLRFINFSCPRFSCNCCVCGSHRFAFLCFIYFLRVSSQLSLSLECLSLSCIKTDLKPVKMFAVVCWC